MTAPSAHVPLLMKPTETRQHCAAPLRCSIGTTLSGVSMWLHALHVCVWSVLRTLFDARRIWLETGHTMPWQAWVAGGLHGLHVRLALACTSIPWSPGMATCAADVMFHAILFVVRECNNFWDKVLCCPVCHV